MYVKMSKLENHFERLNYQNISVTRQKQMSYFDGISHLGKDGIRYIGRDLYTSG